MGVPGPVIHCKYIHFFTGGGGSGGGTTTPFGTTTSGGCNQGWIGDGYCDDVNNNLDCTYDGGDCESCNQDWIGDGDCDDINNNLDCTYDGGDCCGSNVNTEYCTECQCNE